MLKRNSPGIDRAIEPSHGTSRDGQPLSYNRAPAPDLAPWVARLYATDVKAPSDYLIECGLFNDTAMFRIQSKGFWTADTADGRIEHTNAALLFGPQTKQMPISVKGSFVSVGISMRPGAGYALAKVKTSDFVDRLVPCEAWGLSPKEAMAAIDRDATHEERLTGLESLLRKMIERVNGALPDPITSRFEQMSLMDPTINIADFIKDHGIEQRRLERLIKRDFGMTPKQVLRRARALDIASHLRGVADYEEAETLMLRYYDQSHLIREVNELFCMSPRQLVEKPLPILTLALESRQAWRLESISRLQPGAKRPWQ